MLAGRDRRARRSLHWDCDYEHEEEEEERKNASHAHYLIAAVDVNDLAGDRCGGVTGQKNSCRAELRRITTTFQWRALLVMLQHRRKPADATSSQCLNRTCRYAVHANFFGPKIVRQVTRAGFETCLGYSHNIVVRHDLFCSVIGHCHDAASVSHQGRRFARERYQRVRTDVVCDAECFACCTYKIAFQSFSRSERERVKHQIDSVRFATHLLKKCPDLIIAGNVAGKKRGLRSELADEFLHVFFQPFALIIENQPRTSGRPRLRDRPCNAALVRNSEDKANLSRQYLFSHR